ncbi:unnamed protein product [Acanthoscelides obtectus]|uniref:Uncharacterized protein n=1 Tax=Acanthoscelides obtectus TaxID=200917 RepID=A0A9P0PXY9_ACAOB|nr:unnamed protein product [Acanthoscelides obtectus]CAK1680554.1 hypothetical protein AOBTE_LOCUS32754 [Acanthoscelides obtectus]
MLLQDRTIKYRSALKYLSGGYFIKQGNIFFYFFLFLHTYFGLSSFYNHYLKINDSTSKSPL